MSNKLDNNYVVTLLLVWVLGGTLLFVWTGVGWASYGAALLAGAALNWLIGNR